VWESLGEQEIGLMEEGTMNLSWPTLSLTFASKKGPETCLHRVSWKLEAAAVEDDCLGTHALQGEFGWGCRSKVEKFTHGLNLVEKLWGTTEL